MQYHYLPLLLALVPAAAHAQDARGRALANLREDMIAVEAAVRHAGDGIAAMDQQSQSDIGLLADKLGWWQDCAKQPECWAWVKPSGSP